MALVAVSAMLVPVLLVTVVLWLTFAAQIDDSYQKRLETSLSVFELVVAQDLDDFRSSLSRLTADNTIQVTVDLDIRPQLRRYLRSQFDVADFEFVIVSDLFGEQLVSVSRHDTPLPHCQRRSDEPTEHLTRYDDLLLLTRSLPLSYKGRPVGHLCAGHALNGQAVTDSITPRIDGLPLMRWDGTTFPIGRQAQTAGYRFPLDDVFDTTIGEDHYRGLGTRLHIADAELEIGILVDTRHYEAARTRSLLIIAFVVAAVLLITAFGLRMRGLRHQAEQELQREREKAVVTLASIADGVVTTNADGGINYVNPAAESLLGENSSTLSGLHLYDAFELQSESTKARLLDIEDIDEGDRELEIEDAMLIGRNGVRTPVHFSVAPIAHGDAHSGSVITFRDVQRERELRRRLAWKASRDDLTGLLNRSEFRRSLGVAISEMTSADTHHCLIFIDLDEFKAINDTCGHRAGDELLRQVSAGLLSLLRDTDIVARLGGDEFGVLLRHCSRERGVELAEQIIELINDKRFNYLDKYFHVGASIGLVSVTRQTENLEDLLSTVDAACYAAKEKGRNRVFVGEVDTKKILHRMDELSHASYIRQALKESRFTLYRQPIVMTGTPLPAAEVHAEVLLRMRDTQGGMVAPGAFIPIAERYGLMQDIDRWVLRELFAIEGDRLRAWRSTDVDTGPAREFVYSVNLSGASLTDPTFLDFVKSELEAHDIPGGAIAFEITETQIITHLDKAVALIGALKALGCKFLLDDFGSGMSSFGYLKHLPVDYLKIDGLFVRDILTDPIDRSMVKMINEIGHTMELLTIAEYVETAEILREVTEIGVDMAQGYGIAVPEPIVTDDAALSAIED